MYDRIYGAVSVIVQLAPAVDFADLDGNLLISNYSFSRLIEQKGQALATENTGIGLMLLNGKYKFYEKKHQYRETMG